FACGSAGSESDDESSTGALETNASTPKARECSFESIKPCEPQDSATRQRILGTMIAGLQKELRDQDIPFANGEPRLSFAKETTNGGGSFLIARDATDAAAPTHAYAVLYGKLMKANGTDELPV